MIICSQHAEEIFKYHIHDIIIIIMVILVLLPADVLADRQFFIIVSPKQYFNIP